MTVINSNATVDDVLNRHPRTIRVFIDRGMACIGCAIAPYHTIEEACAEYNLTVDSVIREMTDTLSKAEAIEPKA